MKIIWSPNPLRTVVEIDDSALSVSVDRADLIYPVPENLVAMRARGSR